MKKLMSVTILALAGFAIVNAKDAGEVNKMEFQAPEFEQVAVQDTVKRTMVEVANLPAAIITTLSGEEYVDWKISTAYFVEPKDQEAFYEITLHREGKEELRVVKLDQNGQVIS